VLKYLTARDIAEELQCSLSAAYDHMRTMTRLVVGRSVRVHPSAFAGWKREREIVPSVVVQENLPKIRTVYPRTKPR
jgi:hypothetical protein